MRPGDYIKQNTQQRLLRCLSRDHTTGFGLNAVKQLTATVPFVDLRFGHSLQCPNSNLSLSHSLSLWRALGISPEKLTVSPETGIIYTEVSENSSGDEENRRRKMEREKTCACEREYDGIIKKKKLKNKGGGEGCS
jgi:hypothetical protein